MKLYLISSSAKNLLLEEEEKTKDEDKTTTEAIDRAVKVVAEDDTSVLGVSEYAFYLVFKDDNKYVSFDNLFDILKSADTALISKLLNVIKSSNDEDKLSIALALISADTPEVLFTQQKEIQTLEELVVALKEIGRPKVIQTDCYTKISANEKQFITIMFNTLISALDFINTKYNLGVVNHDICISAGSKAITSESFNA